MKLNNRGFTLFTALISLIIVSISLALVFNMIKTEETYLDLVQDQASMSELVTMADLAKADAFNSFLINLRSAWEEQKSGENQYFYLKREHMDKNWTEFVDDFVKEDFFQRGFAAYFARALINNLEYNQNPPGYLISLKTEGLVNTNPNADIETFENLDFSAIIEQIFKDGGEKVDVVDCEQDSSNCVGSFYLTLDTTKLSDSNYELLPIITILRYKNNQVIQRPILNRQVYKIYMPWRGFQAFRVARNIALGEAEKVENPAIATDNTGIFHPAIHNTLEQARLGFCDPGTCAPRKNFFTTPDKVGFDKKCHDVPFQSFSQGLPNIFSTIPPLGGNYDPKSVDGRKEDFTSFYKAVVRDKMPYLVTYSNSGLIMLGEAINDANISSIEVDVEHKRTKQIIEGRTADGTVLTNLNLSGDYSQSFFSTLADISGVTGGLGLFLNPENKSALIYSINWSWYDPHLNYFNPGPNNNQAILDFYCSEIDQTNIYLTFQETDPKYYIKESYNGNPVTIRVVLRDDYTPFFFPNKDTFWSGLSVSNNYLIDELLNFNVDSEDWICYSAVDGEACGIKN